MTSGTFSFLIQYHLIITFDQMAKTLAILTLLLISFGSIAQDEKLVYQFDIKEEIAAPIWRKVQLAMDEAHDLGADAIVINMNTYGGEVDAAD